MQPAFEARNPMAAAKLGKGDKMNQPTLKPWPADKVTRRSVAELAPYARNARLHSDAQVAQIAASIGEWGWTMPVLLDEAGGIIAGHGRVLAAKKLGIDTVPCMVAKGWSDVQKRAYVIADNKIADNAIWDEELLRIEFEGLEALNFDLGLTGFSAEEIGAIRQGLNGGLTDPDEAPEPPVEPVTRLGDVWTMRGHRIVCGDATDKAAAAGAKPHLMVTDPPYGVGYDPMWRDVLGIGWTGQMQRKSTHSSAKSKPVTTRSLGKVENDDRADWRDACAFPGDVAYVWHADRHASSVQASLAAAGFEIRARRCGSSSTSFSAEAITIGGTSRAGTRSAKAGAGALIGRATASRRPFGRSPTPAHSRASKATPSPITGRKSRSSA